MTFHFTFLTLMFFCSTSFANVEVFKIKKIVYKGSVFNGALVAKEVEKSPGELHLSKPRVLVNNMRFGSLDAIVELMLEGQESPLCQALGFRYTEMHDGYPGGLDKLQARFVTKDEVHILPSGSGSRYTSREYVSCF